MIKIVVIPEERKAILIGIKGSVKKKLEKKTNTKIKIGLDVEIEGESLDALKAAEIVKAIGNGFSPENAFLLLKEEYMFEVIPFRAETPESRKRLFARVIGRDGLVKKNLEEKTNSLISIYGKNVSIIAEENHMLDAERAVKNLLSGKSHGHVYKLAERKKTS